MLGWGGLALRSALICQPLATVRGGMKLNSVRGGMKMEKGALTLTWNRPLRVLFTQWSHLFALL